MLNKIKEIRTKIFSIVFTKTDTKNTMVEMLQKKLEKTIRIRHLLCRIRICVQLRSGSTKKLIRIRKPGE